MSSTNHDEEGLIDITDLLRQCASQNLSYAHPFTPLTPVDAEASFGKELSRASCGEDGGGDDSSRDGLANGALLSDLQICGTALSGKSNTNGKLNLEDKAHDKRAGPTKLIPLDLQDAMTALELGDKRMDCCEIPLVRDDNSHQENGSSSSPSKQQQSPLDWTSQVTFPPRIAPTSLSDGTPFFTSSTSAINNDTCESSSPPSKNLPANALLLPTPPCPSLLPHWNNLSLSSSGSKPAPLVHLLILQLTALEAYIGTNNGGSNAAETLYCMLWFHDGVLMDMSKQLSADGADSARDSIDDLEDITVGINTSLDGKGAASNGGKLDNEEERNVARWALFASSLGVVRIAEAVRWAVVNADFYEEEDFGIALHGEKGDKGMEGGTAPMTTIDEENVTQTTEGGTTKKEHGSSSSMRFCPALHGSQYIEIVWDTALSYLCLFRSKCIAKGNVDMEKLNPTIDALETILRLQQSFFQTIKILSNLNDETVRDFTKIAVKRSQETVSLFEGLGDNDIIKELSKDGLVGLDGQLLPSLRNQQPELNLLLSASFDPFVNRRLLGNAPVRKACFRLPMDVLTSLSQVAGELEWGVCDPILHGNTFGRITRMLERNSLRGCGGSVPIPKPKKQPPSKGEGLKAEAPMGMNILSRSLIVLNLYFDDKLFGQYDFSSAIGQHMKQVCAVPELLLETTYPDGGVAWVTRLAKPMYDTLKALCLNRHRERGFTESILLPAFQLLQYEAASVDEKFREEHELDPKSTPAYATNYVILNTIRLMERHVGLGIELGLYPNWYDLSTALWYRDFLLSALINVRGSIESERIQRKEMDLRIKMEQEEEERKAKAQLLQQSKKKGKKGKKTKRPAPQITPNSPTLTEESAMKPSEEEFEDRLEYTSLLLHRNLCRGLVRYIAALRQAKLLPDPPASIRMFTTHQKRFEKRFEAFSTLYQPPSLSYDDYVRGSDFSAVQRKDLLASATDCFRSGKGIVDWLLDVIVVEGTNKTEVNGTVKRNDDDLFISIRREEIMSLAKVCVTNSLFLHKLASITDSGKDPGNSNVSLEFNAHKQYCTMSII